MHQCVLVHELAIWAHPTGSELLVDGDGLVQVAACVRGYSVVVWWLWVRTYDMVLVGEFRVSVCGVWP